VRNFSKKNQNEDLMNVIEVSVYLRIPLKTVYRLAKQGKIKGVKVGKHWRFLKQDIDYYLQHGKNKSTILNQPQSIEGSDRRSYPRINCSIHCHIEVIIPQKKEVATRGIILNISEGGFFWENCGKVKEFLKVKPDDPIDLNFSIDGEDELETAGRAVRIQDNGVAVKFRNISGAARERISRYVG